MKPNLRSLLLILGFTLPATAATYTWQVAGTTNLWSTAAGDTNWYVDAGTTLTQWTDANAAVFSNTTGETVTLTGTVAPTSVTLGASNGTWTFNGTGVLGGTGTTLTKEGTGTLTLSNTTANTFTGGTTINGGTLSIGTGGTGGNTSTVSALGTGAVAINSTATLKLWIQNSTNFTYANNLTINGGNLLSEDGINTVSGTVSVGASGATLRSKWGTKNLILSNVISGTGAVTIARAADGGGDAAATVVLSGANTYSGGTTVTSGVLQLGTAAATDYGATGRIRGTLTANTGTTVTLLGSNVFGYTGGQKVDTVNLTGATLTHAGTADNGWGIAYNLTGATMQTTGTGGRFSFGNNTSVTTLASATTSTIAGTVRTREGNTGNTIPFSVADGAAATDLLVSAVIDNTAAGVGITKSGAGTMTLSGANTYTGTSTINAGTLSLTGTLPGSAMVVNSGTFQLGSSGKTLASLTANNGSTLVLPTGANSAHTTVTGALTLTTGATVTVAPSFASFNIGTPVDLITAGSISGTATLVPNLSSVYGTNRAAVTVGVTGNKLQATVTSLGANLVWNNASAAGVATGTWDTTLANFLNGASNEAFQSLDRVTFDDTLLPGTAKTVNLSGALLPGSVTVNNSNGNYTFGPTGSLTGGGSLVKSGTGTLTLGPTTGYSMTGPVAVTGGTFAVGDTTTTGAFGTLGAVPVSISSGATLSYTRGNSGIAMAPVFSGSGSLTFTGTNNGTATNASEFAITGNSTAFSGPITVTGVRVSATGNLSAVGTGTLTTGAAGQYFLGGYTYNNPFVITGNGWAEAAGVLGAIRMTNGTTLAGPITLAGNARIGAYSSTATISGAIGETGGSRNLELGAGLTSNITLTGASTYTGTTTLTNAIVTLNGSLGATGVTVSAGSTIGGTGSIGSGGSLSFATGATNLNALVGSPLTVNGNVTLGGTTTVNLITAGSPPSGTIPVLNFTGSVTGTTANLALANSANYRQGIFAINANNITVDIGAKSLIWNGTTDGQWVIAGAAPRWNTTGTGETDAFYQGDSVTFDDTGVATAVTLTGVIQPSSITVTGTKNYTLTLTGANYLAGGGSLTKSGTGTLTLTGGANTFTGGTIVNGGTIAANGTNSASGALGGGNITVNNTGTVTVAGDNGLMGYFNAIPKTLRINSGGTVSTPGASNHLGLLVMDGGTLSATTANGTYTNWNLDWGVSTPGTSNSTSTISGGNLSLTKTGGTPINVGTGDTLNISTIVANVGGAGDTGMQKQGSGILNLSAANTYISGTTVSAGTLLVTNTTGSGTGTGAVSVSSGATLAGGGTITGAVTSAGTISPGNASAATLTTGAATITGTYAADVGAATADRLTVNGNLNVTGASLAITATGAAAESYILASYTGTLTGTFAPSGVPSGYGINYDTTNKQILLYKLPTGFALWASTFPGLTDSTAGGDPDNDGFKNLMEYVLGGDPRAAVSSIAPTQTMVGGDLVFHYKRNDDSKADTTQIVQWSTDLETWTDITVTVADSAGIEIEENGAAADDVSVTIPSDDPKVFARLKVIQN